MNKFAVLTVLLLCSTFAHAAQVTKIIHLQYADAGRVAELMNSGPHDVTVVGDNALKIVLIKGDSSALASVEQTIRELDVAPAASSARNIELLIYVIAASTKSQNLPQPVREVDPAVKQLRGIFPYENYGLLDTVLLRGREHRQIESLGAMKNPFESEKAPGPISYQIKLSDTTVSSEGPKRSIHINAFDFDAAIPGMARLIIRTDVDLHEDQKIVVGNADMGGDSALFVVLTAKVLE